MLDGGTACVCTCSSFNEIGPAAADVVGLPGHDSEGTLQREGGTAHEGLRRGVDSGRERPRARHPGVADGYGQLGEASVDSCRTVPSLPQQ